MCQFSPDMKQVFVLLSVLLVIVSSDGEFNCTSGEHVPAGRVCDFKKDCEDGSDEEFCGSCDFEHHSCGWYDNSEDISYDWRWQVANITSIPGLDHTTGSPLGHFMHIDGKQGSMFSKAILELSIDNLAALGCKISFWYYIYDKSSTFTLRMIRGRTERDLLEISKSNTDSWGNATVFIGNQPGGYKLQFFYSPSFSSKADVMLDDISFDNCGEGDVPAGSDRLSCDFQNDTCSWYHDYTASLLWKRSNGRYDEGPAGNGYYMLINTERKPNTSSTARLISFPRPAGQVICVSFLYHIFGNSIGSLKFIAKRSGEAEVVVWMRSGTQGNKWRFGDLAFNSDKPIQFCPRSATADCGIRSTWPCKAVHNCVYRSWGSLKFLN